MALHFAYLAQVEHVPDDNVQEGVNAELKPNPGGGEETVST